MLTVYLAWRVQQTSAPGCKGLGVFPQCQAATADSTRPSPAPFRPLPPVRRHAPTLLSDPLSTCAGDAGRPCPRSPGSGTRPAGRCRAQAPAGRRRGTAGPGAAAPPPGSGLPASPQRPSEGRDRSAGGAAAARGPHPASPQGRAAPRGTAPRLDAEGRAAARTTGAARASSHPASSFPPPPAPDPPPPPSLPSFFPSFLTAAGGTPASGQPLPGPPRPCGTSGGSAAVAAAAFPPPPQRRSPSGLAPHCHLLLPALRLGRRDLSFTRHC